MYPARRLLPASTIKHLDLMSLRDKKISHAVSGIVALTLLIIHISYVQAAASEKGTPSKPLPAGTEPSHVTTTVSGGVDMCLSCHNEKPDRAHGRDVLGCYICHKGDPLAGTVERAHRGMIKNPGEFIHAADTCGATGCHPDEVRRTQKSLMATNRGILSTLRYYWGETDTRNEDITVEKIAAENLNSPAIDYFRKLCGTCHTGMEKGKLPGFLAEKGGGCTACHAGKPPAAEAAKGIYHIRMVKAVPSENCTRCHNRSGRIGLTYQGRYESEGYGTPYDEGELSQMQLEDGRFYQKLPADVHHESGMICADCHTQKEIMGDGHDHAHLEQQLEIQCETCHTSTASLEKTLAVSSIPYSRWKHELDNHIELRINIEKKEDKYFIKGLSDNKLHPLHSPLPDHCLQPVHRRLACQACHSTWVPQCYGCHVQYNGKERQLDKITGKDTPGKWTEFKSFVRFNSPPLGVMVSQHEEQGKNTSDETLSQSEKIVILVPG